MTSRNGYNLRTGWPPEIDTALELDDLQKWRTLWNTHLSIKFQNFPYTFASYSSNQIISSNVNNILLYFAIKHHHSLLLMYSHSQQFNYIFSASIIYLINIFGNNAKEIKLLKMPSVSQGWSSGTHSPPPNGHSSGHVMTLCQFMLLVQSISARLASLPPVCSKWLLMLWKFVRETSPCQTRECY